jgi:hypothetical protein
MRHPRQPHQRLVEVHVTIDEAMKQAATTGMELR